MNTGVLHSINVSGGGVPKLPQPSARVTLDGVDGDHQSDRRFHGGPARAVSIYSLDRIRALQGEGHPIEPGAVGENLTIEGIEWSQVASGTRLAIGEIVLEVTTTATPCMNIAAAFVDDYIARISEKRYPGWSRWYTRVIKEGTVSVGDPVTIVGS
jgi:MOSC domain-containing protein YiiM